MVLFGRICTEDPVLKNRKIELKEDDALFRFAGGDARKFLNIIELISNSFTDEETIEITNENVTRHLQENPAQYDKNGEIHYDIISAFIKSIRGSDPDAAVYWLARMVEGGEDPKFIARRLIISASEDIGLANPNALLLATNAFEAINMVGWPESRIILSEVTIYLATSPKSNSAYKAINNAQEIVQKTGNLPVPLHLRNAPTKLMKQLNYGKEYKYAHDFKDNFVIQDYLPEQIKNTKLFFPQNNQQEAKIAERMNKLWKGRK
jgi:putative ATPase